MRVLHNTTQFRHWAPSLGWLLEQMSRNELNPMTALACKLQSRGNEVVFIGVPDVEPFAHAAGLDFVPFWNKSIQQVP
jgi:hypothetical protein